MSVYLEMIQLKMFITILLLIVFIVYVMLALIISLIRFVSKEYYGKVKMLLHFLKKSSLPVVIITILLILAFLITK